MTGPTSPGTRPGMHKESTVSTSISSVPIAGIRRLGQPPRTRRRRRPRRSRIAGFAAVAGFVALLSSAPTPVSAASTQGADNRSYAEQVEMAAAVWEAETEYSRTSLEVRVFHLDLRSTSTGPIRYKDPGVILFFTHRETDPDTGIRTETSYEGFSGGAGATFDFARSLSGAEATFPLTLWGYRCTYPPDEPQGIQPGCENLDDVEVTAQMSWTGIGEIFRDTNTDRFKETPFALFGRHVLFAVRDAQATANIAGNGLTLADGPASFAVLLRGKYHEHLVMPPVRP